MRKEVSTEAIRNQLQRIIESRTFARSDSNQRLLKYLTEATLKGENPKEYTIGIDVFNRPVEEAANSNVRVYIHKLRKKLEKYYENEGANDPVYFALPSGSYAIEFSLARPKPGSKKQIVLIISFLVVLNIFTFSYYQFRKTPLQKLSKTAFWNDILTNNKPTAIIAGDYFFFSKALEHHRHSNIRDTHINSEKEMRQFISDNHLNLEEYSITKDLAYMPRDALFSMPNIIPVFEQNEVNYEMLVSTDFDWKLFKGQNLMYIGSMKNLKDLIIVFDKLGLEYYKTPERLIYQDDSGEKVLNIVYSTHSTKDPTVVIRIPGPEGSIIHMFVSNHDIGCISATKFFSKLNEVRNFERKYLQDTPYFMAIYNAEGMGRTDVSFELVDIQPIADEKLEKIWH